MADEKDDLLSWDDARRHAEETRAARMAWDFNHYSCPMVLMLIAALGFAIASLALVMIR